MSQASLPTPKSSECSNGSAVGLEPDRRHSAALEPTLSSCVACRTYQLGPVQRSANRATYNSERTRNNSSLLAAAPGSCEIVGSAVSHTGTVPKSTGYRCPCSMRVEPTCITQLTNSYCICCWAPASVKLCISPVRKLMHEAGMP